MGGTHFSPIHPLAPAARVVAYTPLWRRLDKRGGRVVSCLLDGNRPTLGRADAPLGEQLLRG